MENLRTKYEISLWEYIYCGIIRILKGNKSCPKYIFKKSIRKYGIRNNLAHYYIEKYEGIPVGKYTYGTEYLARSLVKSIGRYCSISAGVSLVRNAHDSSWISTSPFLFDKECGFVDKDIAYENFGQVEHSIEIGNDVWLAANCVIFHGVKIGDGAIIAAGAIVRKDVPPYAVVVGVDKIIKYRFSQETINKLLEIKWWDWPEEKLKQYSSVMRDPDEFFNKYHNSI